MKNFSKRQTNILKGIGVLLLLVHHGLDPIPEDALGGWKNMVENSISLAKLCVAVFAVLSGYGMYLSFRGRQKRDENSSLWRFALSHILKLYAVFWLTSLLSIAAVALLKGNFHEIYAGYPLYYAFLDVMGLSYLTHTPKLVNSWWYVTATLLYYCLFPLLFRLVQRLKKGNYLLLGAAAALVFCFPGTNTVIIYGCFFLFGMIFAQQDILNRFLNSFEETRTRKCLKTGCCFLALCGLGVFRQRFLAETKTAYYLDWLIALVLILLVSELTGRRMRGKAGLLELTGRYSFEIYLIHGVFIRYGGAYVYLSDHCLAVLVRLYVASLVFAVLLQQLEKVLKISRISLWCESGTKKRTSVAAGILLGTVALALVPVLIADMGIGNLTLYKKEIVMESGSWAVPLFTETPLFWDMAKKTYSCGEWEMVSFVDGVLYAHYPGQTEASVSLPFGKSVSFLVTVKEAAE